MEKNRNLWTNNHRLAQGPEFKWKYQKLCHVKVKITKNKKKIWILKRIFCVGGNHLIIKESGMTSKKICGTVPKNVIVSTTEELTFVLIVNKPGPRVSHILWVIDYESYIMSHNKFYFREAE